MKISLEKEENGNIVWKASDVYEDDIEDIEKEINHYTKWVKFEIRKINIENPNKDIIEKILK